MTDIDFSSTTSQWQTTGQIDFREITRSRSQRDAIFGVGRDIWRRNHELITPARNPAPPVDSPLPPANTTT